MSSTTASPSSKQQLAAALSEQIHEMRARRREQPSYVAGKIGERQPQASPRRNGQDGGASAGAFVDSMNSAAVSPHRSRPRDPNRSQAEVEANVSATRSLADALERQIAERDAAKRAERDRERQRSRELLQRGEPAPRRTGRAFVPLPGTMDFALMHSQPADPPAHHSPPPQLHHQQHQQHIASPDWGSAAPSPIHGANHNSGSGANLTSPDADNSSSGVRYGRRASGANNNNSRTYHNNSPVRDGSISIRHISPERIRENEYELRSEAKLFDFEKRAAFEDERRAAAARRQEMLKAALEEQIAEAKRKKEEERRREAMLDLEMEQRARAEAAALAERERQREAEAHRAAEEDDAINRELLEGRRRAPSVQQPPPLHVSVLSPADLQRAAADAAHDDGADPNAGPAVNEASGRSPGGDSSKRYHHERHAEAASMLARTRDSTSVSRSEFREVMESLQAIRDELAKGRPLPEAAPPVMIEPPKTPAGRSSRRSAATTPPPPDLSQQSQVQFVHRDTSHEEAKRILERNQQRLAALRFAGQHDDILKAFLLQDSTAAMRTLTQFHSRHSPYVGASAYQQPPNQYSQSRASDAARSSYGPGSPVNCHASWNGGASAPPRAHSSLN